MPVDTRQRYTLHDVYHVFPDDRHRRELIDGVLHVSPLAHALHQRVVGRLTYRFTQWTEVNGGEVLPGANVDLDDHTHLEPDFVAVRPGRPVGDILAFREPPDLVVEVSSPSTRRYDLGVKRERYARARTPEFWFVDRDAEQVLRFVLDGTTVRDGPGDRYGQALIYDRGDTITTPLFPGLILDVDDLLGPPPAARGE